MLVTASKFNTILAGLEHEKLIAFDTETMGLHPFHGDRIFSVAISTKDFDYYFNWQDYPEARPEEVLGDSHIAALGEFFRTHERGRLWAMHHAKYDLTMARMWGWEFYDDVWCTQAQARVENNERMKSEFSLSFLGNTIGFEKSSAVETYIKTHKLYSTKTINGETFKQKRFDLVPLAIMQEYALRDSRVTFELASYQMASIKVQSAKCAHNTAKLAHVATNEVKLLKAFFEMEFVGAKIDVDYCTRAAAHERFEMDRCKEKFKELTGHEFIKSNKLFQELFLTEKHKWGKTKKGGHSIDAKVLKTLDHPAAIIVCDYAQAKNNLDFYLGFLKHRDPQDTIHTSFNAHGTRTGRVSSSNPNLQNLKKPDKMSDPGQYVVRRAIVPREGFFFAMIDYDQIEYRMMLDIAGAHGLIDKILNEGLDVHQATADAANLKRSTAKTVNFLTLYGGGLKKLAQSLDCDVVMAKQIQNRIFDASPEIKKYMRRVKYVAENRGWIFNWLGRVYKFDDSNFSYKAPNTHIQGGAADVLKVAVVKLHQFLGGYKSRIVLNIHDELVFEIAFGEEHILPDIVRIMEAAFPHSRLPLTVGIDYSLTSLADKQPWDPVEFANGKEARNHIQRQDTTQAASPA